MNSRQADGAKRRYPVAKSERRVHPLNLEAGDEAKNVVPAAI